MEQTYRLEFNEKQQHFHLDNYTHEPNTFGWVTLTEHCTDKEFKIFEAFINRNKSKRLTKEYVLRSFTELKGFYKNLLEYGIEIQ